MMVDLVIMRNLFLMQNFKKPLVNRDIAIDNTNFSMDIAWRKQISYVNPLFRELTRNVNKENSAIYKAWCTTIYPP